VTFLPSKKTVEAVGGQKITNVASAARVQIPYNCKKGECGTCEVYVNGKLARACVAILPRNANSVTIEV
jgi:ferredoxin